MRSAADTLKKISLELGGKSPNILFADADFEASVDGALFGLFINQGEVCSAGSRILVERSIYRRVVDAMVEKARGITLGNGLDRATKMGPLVSDEQLQRVLSYQHIGRQEAKLGARRRPRNGRRARSRTVRRADDLLRRRQLRRGSRARRSLVRLPP
jgi:betaine-aldehyde dehydrogenase